MHGLDRGQFLRLGAAGAMATLTGAAIAPAAGAQAPPPTPQNEDIGFVQWAATAELVSVAFWERALAADRFGDVVAKRITAMRDADRQHLEALSAVLADEAPTTEDFTVVLPKKAFATKAGITVPRPGDRGVDHPHLPRRRRRHRRRGDTAAARQAARPGRPAPRRHPRR